MDETTTTSNPLCDFCWTHRSGYGLVLRGTCEPYGYVCAACLPAVRVRPVLGEQLAAGRQAIVSLGALRLREAYVRAFGKREAVRA